MHWLDSLDIFLDYLFFQTITLYLLQNVFNPQKNEDKRSFSDEETYYKLRINKIINFDISMYFINLDLRKFWRK